MISMMVYDNRSEERELMQHTIRQAAAHLTEEKLELAYFERMEQMRVFLKESPLLDMACYDVSAKGSIDLLERIRRQYKETLLLLIAEPSMSPMEYIRPSILASSLLLRPITGDRLMDNLSELWEQYQEKNSGEEEESLVIETREGKTFVPFSKIYYFEAREKKIYLRLKKQELTFYDTLEHLAERLPESFVRCHRSFIVSRNRIRRVMLSKNLIVLEQGMEIPLSRSYKPAFKERE